MRLRKGTSFRARTRASFARLALAAALAGIGGCAMVLGFEDTTLKGGADGDGGGEGDGGGVDGDGAATDGAKGRLSASPESLVVHRGGKAQLQVSIQRGFDVLGDVTARLEDLPSGVTATTATFPGAAESATITVDAAKTASLGTTTVHLTTSAPALPPIAIPLLVSDPAGTPDVTFGPPPGGFVVIGGAAAVFKAIALQADGKIVAAGSAAGGWFVRRFTTNGTLDPTFAATGLPANGEIAAVAIDGAGRIVCVGTSAPGALAADALTVVRLDAKGAVDPTFAGGAFRLAGVAAQDAAAPALGSNGFAVALGAGGVVYAAGSRAEAAGNDSGVALRLTTAGALDPAWNGGQPLVVKNNRFVGAATEANGAVTLAGTDATNAQTKYFLMRRTATGALDTSFGANGVFTFGAGFSAEDFARLSDGSFAVVGAAQVGNLFTAGVATSAGAQAWVRGVATAPGAAFEGVAGLPDKRIVAAGHGSGGANPEARVDRLLADGTRDGTFGDGGTIFLDPPGVANGVDVTLFAAAIQDDGRILVAGARSGSGAVVYRLWP